MATPALSFSWKLEAGSWKLEADSYFFFVAGAFVGLSVYSVR
jgi:hypothetical protein